ncbi:hypothetical protein REC12_17430 [Desulfosporosinus sp. PR]|uniref:hypothetical protein n=1 Tax=Candidatus Desulfosporosinus nitrosoreducens TaxID=3401928 RepID=UPI0027F279C3|nr:hypothetical protein [Desulfosporosinus sp. PR]MDQ7095375.1 hypothetical protein [Desulfosporosinus sp. PR]
MIPSLPSAVLLEFNEADFELWRALQQIEPELRGAFIKEALRLVLQSYNIGERYLSRLGSQGLDEETSESRKNPEPAGSEEIGQELPDFSIEALFTEDQAPDLAEGDSKLPKGYQYIMKNIIGMEDDEDVLKVLQNLPDQGVK